MNPPQRLTPDKPLQCFHAQSKLTTRGIEFMLKMRVAGATAESTLLKDAEAILRSHGAVEVRGEG